jgi:hypothetical protein
MSDQCNTIDRVSARYSRAPFVGVLVRRFGRLAQR